MRKFWRFAILILLGWIFAIAIFLNIVPSRSIAQTPNTISSIQQGIELYQNERYKAALEVWQKALNQEEDALSQSFINSNIALAWQQLGYLQKAEKAVNLSLTVIESSPKKAEIYSEIKAKVLNTKASLQWSKGNFSEAFTTWDLAAKHYLKVTDTENVLKCQLNQVKALQASGFTNKAKIKLEQIHQELTSNNNSQLKIVGLQYLGNVLRKVGDLKSSEMVLQESLNLAASNDTLLELGNTERALSDSYLATNQPELADRYAEKAIANYQRAFDSGNNLKAGLNQLSLAIAIGKWSDLNFLIPQISQSLEHLPFGRSGIYVRLNFIHNLSCLKEVQENNSLACVSKIRQDKLRQFLGQEKLNIKTPSWEKIARDIEIIIQQTNDSKIKSYAIGELGKIYEAQQNWQLAKNYTQQALLTLEGIDAPEISYRWQWQLGRIFKQQGKILKGISAYSAAIKNLKLVRNDLLVVNSEAQFSFRDNIEPIYREYVDLLLQSNQNREVSQENLEQAIQSIDTLQLTEVENFLNCDLSSTLKVQLTNKNLADVDTNAGFIYPIILENRLELIFKLPGQPLKYHTNFVSQSRVEQTIRKLEISILRGYPEQIISSSSTIYNWLIKPLEKYLENNSEITNLVFVLDGELRNIPMGVLYDSKQQEYLIQKQYALALLPSFQVFDLQTQPAELKVLAAGISEQLQVENKSFVGLNVTEELTNIESTTPSSILLNSQFTQPNIQQNLDEGEFSVVHLATHGNFSSNPDETYLVVYDSKTTKGALLKARDLDTLLRQNRTQQPIDLLVLSACETAEGDSRATLGLAGLAIKAGTRSTLATLWQVSDESTVKLMKRFYQELSVPGTSKAIALHLAQQSLLKDSLYQSPFYWSPYVLVGNWL